MVISGKIVRISGNNAISPRKVGLFHHGEVYSALGPIISSSLVVNSRNCKFFHEEELLARSVGGVSMSSFTTHLDLQIMLVFVLE